MVGYALWPDVPLPIVRVTGDFVPNAFVQITPDVARFICPRDEMGQGVAHGLATLVGEELDIDPMDFEIRFAGVHVDYINAEFRVQGTGGSTSMRTHFAPLRQVGADIRALLVNAAAQDLNIPSQRITTDNGHIVVGEQRYPYRDFLATATSLELPKDTPLKDRSNWRYMGTPRPRVDALEKSTGRAAFGIDIDLPDMHRAVVKRSPVVGAPLKRIDDARAKAMPGVTDVVSISTGVAVVAERFWQAKKGAEVLELEWETTELGALSTAQLRADYAQAMNGEAGNTTAERGEVDAALADAPHAIESEYWAPYLAHAPLEPMNAVVRIDNDRVDVWSGTQGPAGAQGLVARTLNVDRDQVHVHSQYLGGGFGRRGNLSHIVEAAEIAKASSKTVQLVWTREDDIRHSAYRPASLMKIRAGINHDGKLVAWHAKRVGGNITPDVLSIGLPGFLPTGVPDGAINFAVGTAEKVLGDWTVDSSSIEGLSGDYEATNQVVEHVTKDHGLPLFFWRSVGHSYTAFAVESAMDELAHQAKRDPIQLRLRNARDNPRLSGVLRAADAFIGAREPVKGRFLGVASHTSFHSAVAQVAEVSVSGNEIRVHHVFCAVDCGIAVNPDIIKAQMEGGIMFGLTAALHGELSIDAGAITQSNFHDYPILRMNEAPSVDVAIMASDHPPTGVGEPGLPPIAPAVANAVFAATGQRLRSLPLRLT